MVTDPQSECTVDGGTLAFPETLNDLHALKSYYMVSSVTYYKNIVLSHTIKIYYKYTKYTKYSILNILNILKYTIKIQSYTENALFKKLIVENSPNTVVLHCAHGIKFLNHTSLQNDACVNVDFFFSLQTKDGTSDTVLIGLNDAFMYVVVLYCQNREKYTCSRMKPMLITYLLVLAGICQPSILSNYVLVLFLYTVQHFKECWSLGKLKGC